MQRWTKYIIRGVAVACLFALPLWAQTPLLDSVTTHDVKDGMEIRIRFTAPVRYLRHFPARQGELLQIYFQVTALDGQDLSAREEVRRVRAKHGLPGFTVSYVPPLSRDATREPLSVLLQFDRPLTYQVHEGRDKRSLYVRVPVVSAEPNNR